MEEKQMVFEGEYSGDYIEASIKNGELKISIGNNNHGEHSSPIELDKLKAMELALYVLKNI